MKSEFSQQVFAICIVCHHMCFFFPRVDPLVKGRVTVLEDIRLHLELSYNDRLHDLYFLKLLIASKSYFFLLPPMVLNHRHNITVPEEQLFYSLVTFNLMPNILYSL